MTKKVPTEGTLMYMQTFIYTLGILIFCPYIFIREDNHTTLNRESRINFPSKRHKKIVENIFFKQDT